MYFGCTVEKCIKNYTQLVSKMYIIDESYFVGWRNYADFGPGFWSCLPSFSWFTVQECWHKEADAAIAAKSLCLC